MVLNLRFAFKTYLVLLPAKLCTIMVNECCVSREALMSNVPMFFCLQPTCARGCGREILASCVFDGVNHMLVCLILSFVMLGGQAHANTCAYMRKYLHFLVRLVFAGAIVSAEV